MKDPLPSFDVWKETPESGVSHGPDAVSSSALAFFLNFSGPNIIVLNEILKIYAFGGKRKIPVVFLGEKVNWMSSFLHNPKWNPGVMAKYFVYLGLERV